MGREVRVARSAAGLTQARLAALAGVSQQSVSLIERGDPAVSLEIRCRVIAATGHELGWRLYPVRSVGLRDSGQLALLQPVVAAAHQQFTKALEVPVGDGLRAADLVLGLPEELLHMEAERAIVDFQGQLRPAQLKRERLAEHESRPVRLILVLPDSSASQRRLAPYADLVAQTLPVPSAEIWRALRSGTPVGGDGILFVRPARVPGS
jgi:DNA-binding XRE family transcriptional regulator